MVCFRWVRQGGAGHPGSSGYCPLIFPSGYRWVPGSGGIKRSRTHDAMVVSFRCMRDVDAPSVVLFTYLHAATFTFCENGGFGAAGPQLWDTFLPVESGVGC